MRGRSLKYDALSLTLIAAVKAITEAANVTQLNRASRKVAVSRRSRLRSAAARIALALASRRFFTEGRELLMSPKLQVLAFVVAAENLKAG